MSDDLGFCELNIVQSLCKRPRMYTQNGRLTEVIAFLIGYGLACKHRVGFQDESVCRTLEWLHDAAGKQDKVVPMLLERHGTDENALKAIDEFASGTKPS